jgi:ferritin
MLKEKVQVALNNQIGLEAYSSQLYLSMASILPEAKTVSVMFFRTG